MGLNSMRTLHFLQNFHDFLREASAKRFEVRCWLTSTYHTATVRAHIFCPMLEFSWNNKSISMSTLQPCMHQHMPPTTWKDIMQTDRQIHLKHGSNEKYFIEGREALDSSAKISRCDEKLQCFFAFFVLLFIFTHVILKNWRIEDFRVKNVQSDNANSWRQGYEFFIVHSKC